MTKNTQQNKNKLIKLLEENPNLLRACKLSGIARATVYRWIQLDPEFASRVELAQETGRDSMIDFAEAKLYENIKNNHQRAVEYFLSHNSSRYSNNAVQERHAAHRNVGRLAKLQAGTDSVYLYPQTELMESAARLQRLNDQAGKLRALLNNIKQKEPIDIEGIDPMLATLFYNLFPEMKERIKEHEIDLFEERIEKMMDDRIALKDK